MSAIDTDPAHAGDHGDEDELDHDTLHITVGGYVTGFVLSVILTAIPFWLVMSGAISNKAVVAGLVTAFAVVQIVVHMIYFLHLNSTAEEGWTLLSTLFTIILVVITLAGSLWVMHHLNTNMHPEHTMQQTP